MTKLIELSTNELFKLLDNQDTIIIDVRSVDAYNGWKFYKEMRGGHIKAAKSLPFKWIKYIDWLEIVQSKGILPHHFLILYGDSKTETEKVANHFQRAGYQNIQIYNNFIDEWSSNPDLPMSHLKRYRQLVSARWLNDLMQTGKSSEYNNNKYVICHAHYRNKGAYEEGHIPGAIDLDTNTLESPETWNRRSPQELTSPINSRQLRTLTRFASLDFNISFASGISTASLGHEGIFAPKSDTGRFSVSSVVV